MQVRTIVSEVTQSLPAGSTGISHPVLRRVEESRTGCRPEPHGIYRTGPASLSETSANFPLPVGFAVRQHGWLYGCLQAVYVNCRSGSGSCRDNRKAERYRSALQVGSFLRVFSSLTASLLTLPDSTPFV